MLNKLKLVFGVGMIRTVTQSGLAELVGFEAFLEKAVALGELGLLLLQGGLENQVLLCQAAVTGQNHLFLLLDLLDL